MTRIVLKLVGNQANLKLIFIAACLTNLVYEALSASVTSSNSDLDDRSWWIPKKIPEYLTYNVTNSNKSSNSSVPAAIMPEVVPQNVPQTVPQNPPETVPEASGETQKQNCTKLNKPSQQPSSNDVIHFTKYQQPEPKYSDGIRFPLTIPVQKNRHSSIIKPRYDNDEFVKKLLLRWMNG